MLVSSYEIFLAVSSGSSCMRADLLVLRPAAYPEYETEKKNTVYGFLCVSVHGSVSDADADCDAAAPASGGISLLDQLGAVFGLEAQIRQLPA